MKRDYSIAVVLKATFERKATSTAKAVRDRASRAALAAAGDGWELASARVRCTARPERAKVQRPVSEREKAKAATLARARAICGELRTVDPRLPKVTIRWVRDGGCGRGGSEGAHAHRGKWWTRNRHGGKRVSLPRNLICLVNMFHRNYSAVASMDMKAEWPRARFARKPYTDEEMADLVAHEIMHMRFTKRTHRSKAFHDAVMELVDKWKAWKAGTFTPPDPTPPWAKPPEPEAVQ